MLVYVVPVRLLVPVRALRSGLTDLLLWCTLTHAVGRCNPTQVPDKFHWMWGDMNDKVQVCLYNKEWTQAYFKVSVSK